MSRGPKGPGDLHSFERKAAGLLEVFQHAEPSQDANRFRAHVLGAGLVAGKCGAIYHQHRQSGTSQQRGRGTAGRASLRLPARRAGGRLGETSGSSRAQTDESQRHTASAAQPASAVATKFTPSLFSHAMPPSRVVARTTSVDAPFAGRVARRAVEAALEQRAQRRVRDHPQETYQGSDREQQRHVRGASPQCRPRSGLQPRRPAVPNRCHPPTGSGRHRDARTTAERGRTRLRVPIDVAQVSAAAAASVLVTSQIPRAWSTSPTPAPNAAAPPLAYTCQGRGGRSWDRDSRRGARPHSGNQVAGNEEGGQHRAALPSGPAENQNPHCPCRQRTRPG